MIALENNPASPVVATPLPAPRVKAKLQPIAGLAPHPSQAQATAVAPVPFVQPAPAPATLDQPPQAMKAMKATVFAAEQRPHSPWFGAKAPSPSPFGIAAPKIDLGRPALIAETEEGIEGVRKLIFGRHMVELQTKVAELQMSLSGEIKRLREALMMRVDEMAGYLHRDMVILREETQGEISQLKTDLFTAATTLSGVRDRLTAVETRGVEGVLREALTELDGRILRQETAFATALDNLEAKFHRTIDTKCADALAVLAKKSDVADMLQKMGSLLELPAVSPEEVLESPPAAVVMPPEERQTPAACDPGWFAAPPSAPLPPPSSVWSSLAKNDGCDRSVADWSVAEGNSLFNHSLIA